MSEKVTIKAERRELHLPAIALRGLALLSCSSAGERILRPRTA